MRYVRTGILYLPINSVFVATQSDPRVKKPTQRMASVFVTMSELRGGRITPLMEIKQTIQKYPLQDMALCACKVSLFLHRHGHTHPRIQVELAKRLLNRELLESMVKLQNEHSSQEGNPQSARPIFTYLLVMHFLKRLYMHHDNFETVPFDPVADIRCLTEFGDALFSLSDHMNEQLRQGKSRNDMRVGMMEFVRNNLFLQQEELRHVVERYHQLYFALPRESDFDGRKQFKATMSEKFAKSMGASLSNLFALGFGILTRFAAVDFWEEKTENPNENFILVWDVYLKDANIPMVEKENILNFFSTSREEMKKLIRSGSDTGAAFDYDLDAFVKYPLLEVGPRLYSLCNRKFMEERITLGPYLMVQDSLNLPGNDQRRAFKSWWGQVFQEYIWRKFKSDIAPKSLSSAYEVFYDLEFKKPGRRATDIMCFIHETGELFMFEITASQPQYAVLTQFDNWDTLMKDIDRLVIEKAAQIHNTIEAIYASKIELRSEEHPDVIFDPSKIKKFRPVVLTLRGFPNLPYIWQGHGSWIGVYETLKARQLLRRPEIEKLQTITANEFEFLAEFRRLGKDPFVLLRAWLAHPNFSLWSFLSYVSHNTKFVQEANVKFAESKSEAFDMIHEVLFGADQ